MEYPFEQVSDVYNEYSNNYLLYQALLDGTLPKPGLLLLKQLLAEVGEQHILNTSGPDGTISGEQYMIDNIDASNPVEHGKFRLLMLDQRSCLFKGTQLNPEFSNYCSLVPLIPFVHKQRNNIPYSSWDRTTIDFIVAPALARSMMFNYPSLSTEEVLHYRTMLLDTRNGTRKTTVTSYIANGSEALHSDKKLQLIPNLAIMMILQLWCAHHSVRTSNMILDPSNWDAMPPALTDPITPPTTQQRVKRARKCVEDTPLPW